MQHQQVACATLKVIVLWPSRLESRASWRIKTSIGPTCFWALQEPPPSTVAFCESWMPSASRPCAGEGWSCWRILLQSRRCCCCGFGADQMGRVLQSFLKERCDCDPPTPSHSALKSPAFWSGGILRMFSFQSKASAFRFPTKHEKVYPHLPSSLYIWNQGTIVSSLAVWSRRSVN